MKTMLKSAKKQRKALKVNYVPIAHVPEVLFEISKLLAERNKELKKKGPGISRAETEKRRQLRRCKKNITEITKINAQQP